MTLRGAEIEPAEWDAMWHFYQDTGARKWGRPYLTRACFDRVGAAMGEAAADVPGPATAAGRSRGALNFVGGDTLYGRYWGAIEEVPFLHFELSYYRAIDWAIEHGLAPVQAGAQGEHKLARGYEPVITPLGPLPARSPDFAAPWPTSWFRNARRLRLELEWAEGSTALSLRFLVLVDRDHAGRTVRRRPRYMPGVVKPQAASPSATRRSARRCRPAP